MCVGMWVYVCVLETCLRRIDTALCGGSIGADEQLQINSCGYTIS